MKGTIYMADTMGYSTATRRVLSAGTITGDRVRNHAGEDLGKIEDLMIDLESGQIAYAVLSFGGFLGLGDKLFAVPFKALEVNTEEHEFLLDASRDTLENAPGFDKDNWPDFADNAFGSLIHAHYQQEPYWEQKPYALPLENAGLRSGVTSGESERDKEVDRERVNQPDLPEELRRRPIDVTKFPGHEDDADLKTADASRSFAVNDTDQWTRK